MQQFVDELRLPELAGAQLVGFVLVLARIGPLFLLAPVLSAALLPARAKFAAACALALALTPIATHGVELSDDPLLLAGTIGQEVGVGLAFALALGVLAAALQAGASVLDTLVGFSFGALVDPLSGANEAVLGRFYVMFASMIFVVSGGIGLMVTGLARSYDVVPLGSFPEPAALGRLAVTALTAVPVMGMQLVAPVLLAVVVADAAFGLVARAVPQMNVFVVGLPVKVIISFVLVALSLPFVGNQLRDDLGSTLMQTLRLLGGG